MKTKTYITGLITTAVVFTGAIFKIQHWPGASIALTAGIFLLLFLFLPMALYSSYKGDERKENRPLYIITYITCLITFMAMLFKIQYWPGAGFLLLIAIPFPFVVFLPVYLYITGKNKNHNIYNTVAVLFLLVIFSSLSALLTLNVSKSTIDDSLLISNSSNRSALSITQLPDIPTDNPLHPEINKALKLLDDYETMLLQKAGISRKEWSENAQSYTMQSTPVAGGKPHTTNELNAKFNQLEASLNEIIRLSADGSDNEHLSTNIATMLFMYKTETGYILADAHYNYVRDPWPLITLSQLKNNLLILKKTI
jgi:hypothetical protein